VEKRESGKIGLASDHAGFRLKEELKAWLTKKGYDTEDFGCFSVESCDYPDFGHPLAWAVADGRCMVGISICGTGNGINMVVNKYPEIRSAICWNREIAALARAHNDANICALPGRFLTAIEAREIVGIFLETGFDGGRHQRRINKIPVS
jgi:ribose 5-phosphate isomerase B